MAYIKLDRKYFLNPYWNQKRTFSHAEAYLDLIQMARFEADPKTILLPNGRQICIERGEIHASLRYLANRWLWSVDKVNRFLKKHISNNEIKHRTQQGESILKLCKYEHYNDTSNTDQTPNQTPTKHRQDKFNKYKESKELNYLEDKSSLLGTSSNEPNTKIGFQEIIDFYNSETKGVFGELKSINSNTRKTMLNARIKEYGYEEFKNVIKKAMQSNFLKGDNKTGFTATFDWIIKPSNFEKIREEKYKNREQNLSETIKSKPNKYF